MFNRKPIQLFLAIIAVVLLLISPTVAIAHSIVDQYFEAQISADKGGS